MKRFVFIAVSVLLLTVHVFAYNPPNMTPDGGDTALGTFITSVLSEDEKQLVRDWLNDDLSFIVYVPSSQRYLLLRANVADDLIINRSSSGLAIIYLSGGAVGTAWDLNGSDITFAARSTINSTPALSDVVILGGRYFDTFDVTFPTPIDTYVADFDGSLLLRDDGGLMSDPVTEPGDGGGLLGFLSNFWDNLKDFFIGLFVPEEGYFQHWYQSLKIEVDEKLSAISALYNGLTGFFSNLSGRDVSLVLEIPANHFYNGSPFISADIFENLSSVLSFLRGILTGFIVLSTAIICYKKLVTIFSE